ncbi:uncharacterized protein LOC123903803 isoform X2 [Trifolium pratense]|uniref:uncharacterized protein LOC123903803 isoform X2 n=1 Tax=Trifolium pratense TaxID=57577 RepID=UPI001E696850|nr:uncharacterized protein LOC123903803 isoform X2 [Trifolium pratense]XP_045809386.1 uncharacterized protein LOC123903803 isoform X2 [Trifolium pratense]
MDLDKYINKYTNVSRGELEKLSACHFNTVSSESRSEYMFECLVRRRHEKREREKKNGRAALRTRPLVQVLSVTVQPKKDSPLLIYGEICGEVYDSGAKQVHELYKRQPDAAEIVGTNTELSLIGQDYSSFPPRTLTPLSWINVKLYDGNDNLFAKRRFCLDEDQFENDYEEVKCRVISCIQGDITFKYIIIPFGVNCRISIKMFDRHLVNDHIDVNGKIVVRYGNTYGNCIDEECVIFDKQNFDFERVGFESKTRFLKIPRCWLATPAYAPFIVTLDLSEFGTSRKILNETIELLRGSTSGDSFFQEEMGLLIMVEAEWFEPDPFGVCKSPSLLEISAKDMEELDTDGEDESSDDDLPSNSVLSWNLKPHCTWPSPAVEIFSVFIGREKSKAIQIHGSVEVLIDGEVKYYIFKREERDALRLQEHVNTAPILDDSRLFENFSSLGMKFDIKDVDGRLAVKGFVDWYAGVLGSNFYHEKQLCSSILGQNGFAAVHYSIFSDAVLANIKVYLNLKRGAVDVYPEVVSGSLITQYSCYDYSTRYNKDYYRIVLFKSDEDSVQISSNGTIPLSRSMVVVPTYSSLVVDVNLSFGDSSGQMLSCSEIMRFNINEDRKTLETTDYSLCMELSWCEIK